MSGSMLSIIKTAAMDAVQQAQLCDVLIGTVTAVNPLVIETENKMVLSEEFLILARNVTDHQTWFSFDNPDIKQKVRLFDKAEKESRGEPLPEAIEPGGEPHMPRPDDIPPPEPEKTTDIQFLKKYYNNTLGIEDENGGIPNEIELPTLHEITIYNHLKVDEKVILIRRGGGQVFYVIDRIGAVEDDS